jgi:hypothetical protein
MMWAGRQYGCRHIHRRLLCPAAPLGSRWPYWPPLFSHGLLRQAHSVCSPLNLTRPLETLSSPLPLLDSTLFFLISRQTKSCPPAPGCSLLHTRSVLYSCVVKARSFHVFAAMGPCRERGDRWSRNRQHQGGGPAAARRTGRRQLLSSCAPLDRVLAPIHLMTPAVDATTLFWCSVLH